jgi:2-hydroxyglutarate dehydrogenase
LESNIPHKRIGKLVVARRHQKAYLDQLVERVGTISKNSNEPPTPVELISGDEARESQPDLSPDIAWALHSPETGIVDSHALMESFEKEIGESESGELVYSTRVVRVDPYNSHKPPAAQLPDGTSEGWVVQTVTSPEGYRHMDGKQAESSSDTLLARVLINASGLNANLVLNSLLPRTHAIPMYYARGSYAAYRGPGTARISQLIYPVPDASVSGAKESFKFQSLGTHLTLDIDGNVRFGPDIEWLTPPCPPGTPADEYVTEEDAIDFWEHSLAADDNKDRIETMHRLITAYLPAVALKDLRPDYVGIRPKLVGPGGGFHDFQVRIDRAADFGGSGNAPMVSLLGFESPGLTSSLAIAEYVVDSLTSFTKQRVMG